MQTAKTLLDQVPVLARHEGVWDGVYRYYDADGKQTDEHASRLVCRFTRDARVPYHQTNMYRWADGRSERREFPAAIEDGRLNLSNDLISGWAADTALDEFARTSLLYWVRPDEPGKYWYEMIQLSDCGQYRSRVWQRFEQGRLAGRTLIDEHKVSDDWSDYPLT